MSKFKQLIVLVVAITAACRLVAITNDKPKLTNQDIAHLLGWVPSKDPHCKICGGYFQEPKDIVANPNPTDVRHNTTHVTADGPTKFVENGASILQKNVRVSQPGRLLKADKAYIYRDAKTGKINAIELKGHVYLQQKNRLIIGKSAYLDLSQGSVKLRHGLYHIYYLSKKNDTIISAWGKAGYVEHDNNGITKLYQNVSYSTCAPIDPSWTIQASRMTLDKKQGVGNAHNIILKWHGLPLLWSPYYSFPLDSRRKTGLLAPTIGYSGRSGPDISIPFYWNLASNYDDTITPRYIGKRGLQINNLFRYLTLHNAGKIFLSILPNDSLFGSFKQNILANTPSTAANQPYIDALNKTSGNRWMLRFNNHTQWAPQWYTDINLNKVSDDYYLTDFSLTQNGIIANQLLNQADIHYDGAHWQVLGLVQGYQTLHPINQTETQDQYQRLPEFSLQGDYPNLNHYLSVSMQSSIVNFAYHSQFQPNMPTGQRLHIRPSISIPMTFGFGDLAPSLYIDNTDYIVHHPFAYQNTHSSRTLPIFDVDADLYFDRSFHWGDAKYKQTLQPEIFYLYVPYSNQNAIPVYDTYVLPFNYNQLFSLNRFTGVDRLQNANQVSMGVTSRIIDSHTGMKKLQFDIGAIYYIDKPKVCLTPGCTPATNNLSPIVADAQFYPSNHWSTSTSWAWDPNVKQSNNIGINLNYHADNQHLFSIGYNLINETDTPQYSDLTAGYFWPIGYHWSALGYTYYNIQAHRPDSYYLGFQYQTCCWTLRLIAQREFTGKDPITTQNQYQSGYYVQLQLKGLGAIGNRNTDELLTSTLPGYNPLMH